jgi:hypothetical protein
VDLENPQIMHCILCHKIPVNATNLKTQVKSELISYFKTNGISSLKKHVNANHGLVAKMFEKEVNNLFRGQKGKATIKKRGQMCLEIRSPNFLL